MKKAAGAIAILILLAGLGFGIVRLFTIRFAQGDVYPAYSTFRADGLGSKALHDSLAELMPVERNYQPLSDLEPAGGDATIFLLGVQDGFEENSHAEDMERLAQEGNRVVLAFFPYDEDPDKGWPTPSPTPKAAGKKAPAGESKEEKIAGLRKHWGVKTAFNKQALDRAKTGVAGLEPELSWHSAMYFDKPGPEWRVIYSSAGKAVMVERSFEKGSIVLVADSYFSSNEALSKERATGLISELVGNKGTVIFDETHLGVAGHPGVASLMRKFQLQGVVMALTAVAALFVWHNAVAFVPRREDEAADDEIIRGFDASAAFVSLLRRNIPLEKLVATCLVEWKRSFGHRTKAAAVARVEAAAGAGARQPVETFRIITQILNEKK